MTRVSWIKTEFERQVSYLSQHLQIIHLSEAVHRQEQGDVDKPTAVITFNDGYQNNYGIAFPILQKYNAPATAYLVSDQLNSDDNLWFCRLNQALASTNSQHRSWNGMQFDLSNAHSKVLASAGIQSSVKGW